MLYVSARISKVSLLCCKFSPGIKHHRHSKEGVMVYRASVPWTDKVDLSIMGNPSIEYSSGMP